jgi:hypothetical protein
MGASGARSTDIVNEKVQKLRIELGAAAAPQNLE